MRPSFLAVLALPLFAATASARPNTDRAGPEPSPSSSGHASSAPSVGTAARSSGGGGGGGGGPLSRTSAGIGSASRGGGSSSSSAPSEPSYRGDGVLHHCYDVDGFEVECPYGVAAGERLTTHRKIHAPGSGLTPVLHVFLGAQKVTESDGAGRIELAITEGRLRVAGSFTRFFERQRGGDMLTMSMPTLTGGIRIDDMGKTAVFVEGGVAYASTDGDPMGDTSLTGPLASARVEHSLSKDISLIGEAQHMWFKHEIRASAGSVGVRYGHVQAGFRVLDFNVGPPLYGPEVGVRF